MVVGTCVSSRQLNHVAQALVVVIDELERLRLAVVAASEGHGRTRLPLTALGAHGRAKEHEALVCDRHARREDSLDVRGPLLTFGRRTRSVTREVHAEHRLGDVDLPAPPRTLPFEHLEALSDDVHVADERCVVDVRTTSNLEVEVSRSEFHTTLLGHGLLCCDENRP